MRRLLKRFAIGDRLPVSSEVVLYTKRTDRNENAMQFQCNSDGFPAYHRTGFRSP